MTDKRQTPVYSADRTAIRPPSAAFRRSSANPAFFLPVPAFDSPCSVSQGYPHPAPAAMRRSRRPALWLSAPLSVCSVCQAGIPFCLRRRLDSNTAPDLRSRQAVRRHRSDTGDSCGPCRCNPHHPRIRNGKPRRSVFPQNLLLHTSAF